MDEALRSRGQFTMTPRAKKSMDQRPLPDTSAALCSDISGEDPRISTFAFHPIDEILCIKY